MKKKMMIALSVLTALTMTLAGCGSSQAESTATEGGAFTPSLDTSTKATLNFVGSWGNFEALDQVALDFQKYYPDVEVVYTQLNDYRNDLSNLFATGKDIDIFMSTWWDEDYIGNEEAIANAEDLSEAGLDLSNLNADMLTTGQVDGRQLMVPLYLMSWGYMINNDIFESAGVEVPTTYEELLSACQKLKEAGYDQPVYINSSLFGRAFIGESMTNRLTTEDNESALEATLSYIDELYATGYFNNEGDSLEDAYEAMILRFFEGDIPIQPICTNNFSGTKKREAKSEAYTASPFDYSYIPISSDENGSAFIDQLGSIYIGVYKDSEQLDLVHEFLRFMLTDEEMLTLQTIKNMPTANANNGLDTFPYLKNANLIYTTKEGFSPVDEGCLLNALSAYDSTSDHTAMYEKMDEYMENF